IRLGTACHAPAPPHPGAWNALSYPRTVAARHLPGPARRTLLAQSVHRDIRRQTARRQVRMADRTEDRTLRLQVAGAKPQDVGRGTARLPSDALHSLGLREGDVIEVIGKRSTGIIALPPYPEDNGLSIVRLDGLERSNAGVGIGDSVEVRRAETQPARRVVLAPSQPNVRLMGTGEALRRTLFQRPVTAGDLVSTSIYQRGVTAPDSGLFPEDLFRTLFQMPAYGLQEFRLRVVSTQPRGIVRVAEDTEIELLPEYTEAEEAARGAVTYDDVGGLGDTITQVREMIEL